MMYPYAVFGIDLSVEIIDLDSYYELLHAYHLVQEGSPILLENGDGTNSHFHIEPKVLLEEYQYIFDEHGITIPNGTNLWLISEDAEASDVRPGSLLLGYGLTEFPSIGWVDFPRAEWITWVEKE